MAPYLKYLDYRNSSTYSFLALWVIGTYFFPIFKAYPYVCFSGKESAMTKCLPITQQMAFNAVQSSNIDSSSLYSIVEGQRATFLIDEAETSIKSKEHGEDRWLYLRQLLRDGNKPGNPVPPPEKNGKVSTCAHFHKNNGYGAFIGVPVS